MFQPTFEEAVDHWPRLSAGDRPEGTREDDLYQVCEEVILTREITCDQDALIVCQVLLDNMRSGQRSDELDIHALTSLRNWIGRTSEVGGG